MLNGWNIPATANQNQARPRRPGTQERDTMTKSDKQDLGAWRIAELVRKAETDPTQMAEQRYGISAVTVKIDAKGRPRVAINGRRGTLVEAWAIAGA